MYKITVVDVPSVTVWCFTGSGALLLLATPDVPVFSCFAFDFAITDIIIAGDVPGVLVSLLLLPFLLILSSLHDIAITAQLSACYGWGLCFCWRPCCCWHPDVVVVLAVAKIPTVAHVPAVAVVLALIVVVLSSDKAC